MSSRYSEAGVDIDAANEANRRIGEHVRSTWTGEVLSEVGNFGGLFRIPEGLKEPVLVSSIDGVGTKLKVALMAGKHDTIGEDLVNHCVNDILVQGGEPLFFLDYYACGKLRPEILEEVVSGISRGCKVNGCALIGGETAEMPGLYSVEEYDLAGCIVGVVERDRIIDGKQITPGDSIWAFPSNGLHTNGYSLARRIVFEKEGLGVDDRFPGTGRSVAEVLLDVHVSYLPEIRTMRECTGIRGLAHITGGGLLENIPRILPGGCAVTIDTSSWEVPELFSYLGERGGVEKKEMYRVFNMGIGMIAVIPASSENKVASGKYRFSPFRIGEVVEGDGKVILYSA